MLPHAGFDIDPYGCLALVSLVVLLLRERRAARRLRQELLDSRLMEEVLRSSQERFRLMVESIRDYAIFMLDASGHVTSWNAGAERIKGYRSDEIIGRHFSIFYPADERARQMPEQVLETARREGRWESEAWRVRKDGSRFWAHVIVTALYNPDGTLRGYAKVTRDVTERRRVEEALRAAMNLLKRSYEQLEKEVERRTRYLRQEIARRRKAEEALRRQAITDALTGLYNRRGLMVLGEEQVEQARLRQEGLWLFMADLDRLKSINDTYGHAEGDWAISRSAVLLRKVFQSSDVIARIGGDEFCVLARDGNGRDFSGIAARLQEELDDYNRYSGRPYRLGLSLGSIRVPPSETGDLGEWMSRADRELYKHKRRSSIRRRSSAG